ncbi:MAG: transcription antitermination factor NusB [Bacteroidales bacterium]|nr:transcription antitermination factor NusB [Bacteroidales bacterium]
MQVLYAYLKTGNNTMDKSEKELFFSIDKAFDLYHYLFLLLIDVRDYFESRMELSRQKHIPSHDDLNPNTRFVENAVIKQIESSRLLQTYLRENKMSWVNNPELIKSLYNSIKESNEYNLYLTRSETGFAHDKELIMLIYENHIATNELLHQILEEQSIYWNDDLEFIISMMLKTLKGIKPEQEASIKLMDKYKNQDDIDFVKTLFRRTILNSEEHEKMIKDFTSNWDLERIAFMDILLMKMALTEVVDMPSIPTRVTMNEYIELAKFYSTPKSSTFINGILDKIINTMKKDKKIVKRGRGLIGEQ